MRIRTGHHPDDWHNDGPANGANVKSLGGSLVVGGSGGPSPVITNVRKALKERERKAAIKKEAA